MLEDIKIILEDFGGLYMRGMDDTIPSGHFKTCQNATFTPRQISERTGSVVTYNFNYRPRKVFSGIIGSTYFFLILDDAHQLHRDAGPSILDGSPDMSDFSALNLFNRIYIAPNRATWADDTYQKLWVYTGTGNARLAGGVKPSSGVTAADGAAGVVSKGIHKLGVSFVTDTGFITPPNATLTSYTAPGLLQISLTNIPLGPAECVGRRITSTKAGEEELFFVPGAGIINNNTATTATLDYADTDLVASADYLLDIYERIPSGTQLVFYKGRLCVVGANWLVRVSNIVDPETFSGVTGFLALPSEDYIQNHPVAGWVLRDSLYISKFPGVFAVQDTGDPSPNNWPVTSVDESIGCYPNGIGSFTAAFSGRSTSDHNIILTQQGICLFDGVFRRPPMTWKIEDLWDQVVQGQINNPLGVNLDFWKFTLSHDIVMKKLYVNCATVSLDPLIGQQWFVLHADYAQGWDANRIKWSMWTFPFRPAVVAMALHPVDNKYALRITSFLDTKMWTLTPNTTTDAGTNITLILDTGLLDKEIGVLTYFLGLQFRAKGNCIFGLVLSDGVRSTGISPLPAIVDLSVVSTASKDFLRLCNFTSEKVRLKITTGGPVDISRIELKCRPVFLQRPQL